MFGGVLATASKPGVRGEVSGNIRHSTQERRKTLVVSYGYRCLYAAHHLRVKGVQYLAVGPMAATARRPR